MQVHLIADVEYLAKYGVEVNMPKATTIENQRADLNYLIFAVLAKGLASNDSAMKERFKALCPDGNLVEIEKREPIETPTE